MPTVTRERIPGDVEGFRKYALDVFIKKAEGYDLDSVMIDLGYTQKEIDKARNAGQATLVYTITLKTSKRSESMGRDYLVSVRDAARSHLGVQRDEELSADYAYTRTEQDD